MTVYKLSPNSNTKRRASTYHLRINLTYGVETGFLASAIIALKGKRSDTDKWKANGSAPSDYVLSGASCHIYPKKPQDETEQRNQIQVDE